jgi:hypothetical protein
MNEAAEVLGGITGISIYAFPVENLVPPAGYIFYPDEVVYDQTYGRGEDMMNDLGIILITSLVTDETARDLASKWSAGSGAESVKERMERHTWASCDDLTINRCRFIGTTMGGVDYLALEFSATVTGSGEEE